MKNRILFVDDDPNILQGLQRMLRARRAEWDMGFVEGGEQALAALAASPYEVVVSDMRMPGMDGVQLLTKVRDLYPATVGIVLSGGCDDDSAMQVAGPAHQYLSKPCDEQELHSVVTRACMLRASLASSELGQVIARISALPCLPSLYFDLVDELDRVEPSLSRVAAIVGCDLGLTAKFLQLVNSGFLGLRRHVSTPIDAVKILGLRTIWALVLSHHTFSQYEAHKLQQFPLEAITAHSLRVGAVARTVSQSLGGDDATMQDAFTAGLMHDVGLLVLADNLPDDMSRALTLAREEDLPLARAEREVFGTTHQEVGAYLIGLWGLRDSVVEAIIYHHDLPVSTDCPVALAVHLADVLDYEGYPRPDLGAAPPLTEAGLAAPGVPELVERLRSASADEEDQDIAEAA